MTITGVILVAANVSLAMTMLCAGMGGLSGDTTYLIRRRGGKALSRTENTRNANRQTALMLPVVQADGPLGHGASAGG